MPRQVDRVDNECASEGCRNGGQTLFVSLSLGMLVCIDEEMHICFGP